MPGIEWSPDWIKIIREKIEALWDRPNKFTKGLYNINTGHSDFSKYVFDPDLKTVTPPYDRCVSKEKCDHMFIRKMIVKTFAENNILWGLPKN